MKPLIAPLAPHVVLCTKMSDPLTMPDEITTAIKVALASRGITLSDEDAAAVRSAIESVWGPPPKVDGIFSLRDTWAALRLVRWALEQVALPSSLPSEEQTAARASQEAEALCKAIFALSRRTMPTQ
jgi:hypothetical protein